MKRISGVLDIILNSTAQTLAQETRNVPHE